jgi:hypothetical protein
MLFETFRAIDATDVSIATFSADENLNVLLPMMDLQKKIMLDQQ